MATLREDIQAALEELGDTADDIAKKLQALGLKGNNYSVYD